MAVAEITPTEFVERRSRGESLTLLDVREEWELGVASVPDVIHIPMGEVADRLGELDRSREVVVLCRSGRRSLQVANFLQQTVSRRSILPAASWPGPASWMQPSRRTDASNCGRLSVRGVRVDARVAGRGLLFAGRS